MVNREVVLRRKTINSMGVFSHVANVMTGLAMGTRVHVWVLLGRVRGRVRWRVSRRVSVRRRIRVVSLVGKRRHVRWAGRRAHHRIGRVAHVEVLSRRVTVRHRHVWIRWHVLPGVTGHVGLASVLIWIWMHSWRVHWHAIESRVVLRHYWLVGCPN